MACTLSNARTALTLTLTLTLSLTLTLTLTLALALAACTAPLALPADAQISCKSTDDCPADLICLTSAGRCASKDSPCVGDDGDAVADGTACGDGRECVGGICSDPRCGDGVLQPERGEECDPGADALCHDDCKLPVCGDGLIDVGETCDSDRADCVACIQTCRIDSADCNGDSADGCDCASVRSFPSEATPLQAFVHEGALVGVFAGGVNNQLIRVSLDDGSRDVLADSESISLASDGASVFATVQTGAHASELSTLNDRGALVHSASFDALTFGLAVDADSFAINLDLDLVIFDRATMVEQARFRSPFICFQLELCADTVICGDFNDVAIADRAGPDWRTVFQDPDQLTFSQVGCAADGRPLWTSPTALHEDAPDGDHTLTTFISGQTFALHVLRIGRDPVIATLSGGAGSETSRLFDNGTLGGIAGGVPLAFGDHTLVTFDVDNTHTSAFYVFSLEGD